MTNNTKQTFLKKSYLASIAIDRDLEEVWQVLSKLEDYHEWNPFTPAIKTNWELGAKVELTVAMKPDRKPIAQTEYLSAYEPPYQMAWGFKWGPFLKANRIQQLTLVNNQTEYYTEDIIEGPLAPLVHLLYGRHIQRGFELLAKALKDYVEGKVENAGDF
jgi:hypothetical protein